MKSRMAMVATVLLAMVLGLGVLSGCKGWTMDYGTPAAQFEAVDVAAHADRYVGKKISVRGKVVAVDTSDAANCTVTLEHGIVARFGEFKAAAEACKIGEVEYLDGIVESVDKSGVVLEPAFGLDSTAPFDPMK